MCKPVDGVCRWDCDSWSALDESALSSRFDEPLAFTGSWLDASSNETSECEHEIRRFAEIANVIDSCQRRRPVVGIESRRIRGVGRSDNERQIPVAPVVACARSVRVATVRPTVT